jgi:transaldolase
VSKLQALYEEQGQSPWLDNLTRTSLRDGSLARFVLNGIRGVTANPTIFAKSVSGSDEYDDQFAALTANGSSVVDAYWVLLVDDVEEALELLRPVFESSSGADGFVSIEVSPEVAQDTDQTIAAAANFHSLINKPNLLVKVPATSEGITALRNLTADGLSINVTLIFSLQRYGEVIEAYLDGLEKFLAKGGDLSTVHSVASFFVSRVDSEIDRRLDSIGSPEALALRGLGGVAQAKLAYSLFREKFSGSRWDLLKKSGARLQRPLWASTSAKNPDYSKTLYVDGLIAPDTINTLTEATISTFEKAGTVARTIGVDTTESAEILHRLRAAGVDLDDIARELEGQGVKSFRQSFNEVISLLTNKSAANLDSGAASEP